MPEYPSHINMIDESNIVSMSNLGKLLLATGMTNQVLKDRGNPSGCVNTVLFLFTGNVNCFTAQNNARVIASTIDYQDALLEVQLRLLNVAANMADSGITLTSNDLINRVLEQTSINIKSPDYSEEGIKSFVNDILLSSSNSDVLSTALRGYIRPLQKTTDLSQLRDVVIYLENCIAKIDPQAKNKMTF